jgi:outer membrane protein TolC
MAFHLQISKFICVVLFLGTVAAHAETLDQLTAEALRNNPELCVIEQSVITARGGVTTAQTYANPELTLAPGVKRVREAGNSTSEFHGIFELSQPFKFPGKRALEIAIARRSFQSQEIALEALRFQLAVKVRRAFYESLAAQNALGVRGEQVESARTFAAAAQKRVESGFAGDFETVKSLADLIAARKAERQAEGRLATARVALNTLVGRAPTAPLKISGTQESVGPRGSLPDFTALALARNPALLAQNAEAEKAGLNLHLARFGNRPDFAIGPRLSTPKPSRFTD